MNNGKNMKKIRQNLILRTYLLEMRFRWKRFLFFTIITAFYAFLFSFTFPYHYDINFFYRQSLRYFKVFLIFVSCFFFADIVCSEFRRKTGYIMFPKIDKSKLILGKFIANLNLMFWIVVLYYLITNFCTILIYGKIIPESNYSLGIAIIYTITLCTSVIFFSTILPRVSYVIVTVILLYLIGFPALEQILTTINQEIEPILSLWYIGNLIIHAIPGGLPIGHRWNWVYYAGEELPPVKVWLTPTTEVAILVMIIYTSLFFLCTLIILKRKEL